MIRFRAFAVAAAFAAITLAATSSRADTVILKNGTRLEGKVKVQEFGKYVVIELSSGVVKTVMWDDLKEIEVAPPSTSTAPPAVTTAPPAATAAPTAPDASPPVKRKKHKKKLDKTEAKVDATKDGVSGSMVHECGEGDPACREELAVKLDGGQLKAKYESVKDCADEEYEVCEEKTSGSAGSEGLSLKYSKESAKRVTGPVHGALYGSVNANFVYGSGETFSMMGFGAGGNVRILNGGLFPGPQGGSWFGYFVEPNLQFNYTRVTTETKQQCFGGQCSGGGSSSSTSSSLIASGLVGLQFMKFDRMDQKSLQQSGWGLALGAQLGAYIPFQKGAEVSATYGAAANLLFPKYNPGTGSFSNRQLNIFILPTKDIFLLVIGLQTSFG